MELAKELGDILSIGWLGKYFMQLSMWITTMKGITFMGLVRIMCTSS